VGGLASLAVLSPNMLSVSVIVDDIQKYSLVVLVFSLL